MTATKTNEREGTRAVLRHSRLSPYKVRPVLDMIRGRDVQQAREALQFSERDAAQVVGKLLESAVANAETNDGLDPDGLYVSACYADEGPTLKRWRPRARGRATRIRKRTCHVTVIVNRLADEELARIEARRAGDSARRARRVAGGRQGRRARREGSAQSQPEPSTTEPSGDAEEPTTAEEPRTAEPATTEAAADETTTVEGSEPASPQERSDGGDD